ncbi:MAG: histidine kinase [Bacteroidota bacterium]|nr:histidine kinase [Bacteroidota bacterium]
MKTTKTTTGILFLLLLSTFTQAVPALHYPDSTNSVFIKITGNEPITARAEDFNSYWIGTNNGLWIINKHTGKSKHFVQGSVLPSCHVTAICVAPNENVYVSTDKGILRFDGYCYITINSENSGLPSDNITSMACDNDGNLWIGTRDKGLVVMNHNRSKAFNTHNSLLNDDSVKGIYRDNDGNIMVELANRTEIKIGPNGMQLIKNVMELNEWNCPTTDAIAARK